MKKVGLIPLRKKVGELERSYFVVQKDIVRRLFSIDPVSYTEAGAVTIHRNVNKLVDGLNRISARWANDAVPLAYEESRKISETRLHILGAEKNKKFDSQKHKSDTRDFIDAVIEDLVKANESIKKNIQTYLYLMKKAHQGLMQIQEFAAEDEVIIEDIIRETIRQDKARTYASNLILNHFRRRLLDAQFVQIKGRNYNLKAYSRLVARTRLRETQTRAVENICEQFDNDLVHYSKHSNPCERCQPHEGKVYSLSGNHPKYPYLPPEKRPPLHPQCEHDLTPTSEVAIRMREKFH